MVLKDVINIGLRIPKITRYVTNGYTLQMIVITTNDRYLQSFYETTIVIFYNYFQYWLPGSFFQRPYRIVTNGRTNCLPFARSIEFCTFIIDYNKNPVFTFF